MPQFLPDKDRLLLFEPFFWKLIVRARHAETEIRFRRTYCHEEVKHHTPGRARR